MVKRFALVLILTLLSALPVGLLTRSRAAQPDYDIVIINGRIIDGTGNPWFYGSVGVKGDRIAAVGPLAQARAGRVIDAKGLVVAPGFIDVHTHVEGSLADTPTADNFIRMGVTSIVTGNCGSSALDVGDFLSKLEAKGVSVNVATLVGQGSVRREVMKEEDRAPTPEELDRMRDLVSRAMSDGAVGMSSGLEYAPSMFAKTSELIELARVVARSGGIYATHMRNEGNEVADSIKEALTVGEQAGLPVEISHFKISSKKRWGEAAVINQMVADARARGQQVTVDQYAYTASATSLAVRLPDWVLAGGREKVRERLENPSLREKIKREMIASNRKSGFKDYSYAVVSSYKQDPSYEGKTITEITKAARGRATPEDEAEQIITMYLAGPAGMIYHKMSEADVERIIAQPFTMIASDSSVLQMGSGSPHPRGYGNNARVLARYVREQKVLALEDAVRKMTSLPASTFKLWDRGLLRAGASADIVIFDDKGVSDRATFARPHQYSEGFRYVLVNGKIVIDNGEHIKATPGRALYGPGKNQTALVKE